MSWSLQGTYFENCSCDMVCPCTTSGLTMPADQERCGVMLAFHVSKGEIEGTDVSDKTVIIVADTPPIMAEGNWRVGVIMDASATEEQAQKLGAVFGGQAGGPMAAPDGPVEKLTGIFHPANSTLTIAKATKGAVDAFGLTFRNDGKNGHSAPFTWAS